MLTPEQIEEKERQRQERAQSAQAEIDAMDTIYEMGSDEGIPETSETPVETETPVEVEAVAGAAEQEVPAVTTVVSETKEEVGEEEEYDFSFINEMARAAMIKQSGIAEQEHIPIPQPTPVVQQPTQVMAPLEVVTLDEMKVAFESPEKMVELMGKVYQRAKAEAVQESLLQLPKVAQQVSAQVVSRMETVRKFFQDNPELQKFPEFVSFCAQQVEMKHPEWATNHEKIAEETAKLAKSKLPLFKTARGTSNQRPALPGSGRAAQRRNAPADLSDLEKEIAAMPDMF